MSNPHEPVDDDDAIVDGELLDDELPDDELPDDESPDDDLVAAIEEAMVIDDADLLASGGSTPRPGGSDLAAELADYRDALLRVKADFDNYKKREAKQQTERVARAAEGLVAQLLPVLDACEAAVAQGAAEVEPILKSLRDTLVKEGLEAMDDLEAPFDPARHEAVMHEDGDDGEQLVSALLRSGYLWKGRVIRPAMVKVRG